MPNQSTLRPEVSKRAAIVPVKAQWPRASGVYQMMTDTLNMDIKPFILIPR